jgi:tRNA pseudouridine38-40 synthase
VELSYDGTDFEGWQRQATGRTVQGELELALARILGSPHSVVGCGRTDAGVHARFLLASFQTTHEMPAADMTRALDAVLPADVGIQRVLDAPSAFHARRDAAWKWYRYTILVSRRKRPLLRREVLRLAAAPPLDRLQQAARPLVGRHDYMSFANVGSPYKTTVRTVHQLVWSAEGPLLHLDVVGDGFLYKMVRTLVGTMLQTAGTADPAAGSARILAARDRAAAGPAVPALGLCLMAVAVRGEPAPSWVPETLLPGVESEAHRVIGGTS